MSDDVGIYHKVKEAFGELMPSASDLLGIITVLDALVSICDDKGEACEAVPHGGPFAAALAGKWDKIARLIGRCKLDVFDVIYEKKPTTDVG